MGSQGAKEGILYHIIAVAVATMKRKCQFHETDPEARVT
jgi:hypothetical protein